MKTGDRVTLVWACCAQGRRYIGWTGQVEAIDHKIGYLCECGYKSLSTMAWITISGGRGVVPVAWLSKRGPAVTAEQTEETFA